MVIFCNTVCIRDVIINSTHFAINLQLLKEFGQEAQLPQRNSASAAHVEGARPSSPLHLRPLWLHLCVWSNSKATTYVCQVCRPLSHFKVNRAFKVIQGHPYWCRQESRMVCCRNVKLMPTLFLKLTKIRQREHSKFVHFNDPTHV